jgi:hypothetical protein
LEKKLKVLKEALLKKFSSMLVSVSKNPVPNSPDFILASVRELETAKFGPSEYVQFGRLIEWCQAQGAVSKEEARLLGTF